MTKLTVVVLFAAWSVIIFGIGEYTGLQTRRKMVMRQVEKTIIDCVANGKPFVFLDGNLGIIIEQRKMTGYSQNRVIAYRAISFVYPEDDPMWMPVNKFGNYKKEEENKENQ